MIQHISLTLDAATGHYKFDRHQFPKVLGPVDFALSRAENSDCLIIGKGLFAGSILPGSNRLIFAGRSPFWGGFYLSTMGGAALVFDRLGIEFVVIENQAPQLSVLVLRRLEGEVDIRLEPINARTIWRGGYHGEIGFYALQQAVFDKYSSLFTDCRILATGPASYSTNLGAIGSAPIKNGEITPVDTWAGRGGLGSKMVQDHGIVAIIYGGDYDEPDNWRDRPAIDGQFIQRFDKSLIAMDKEATQKYRYDPVVESGGTFGVNYSKLKDWMLSFNYRSVDWTDEKRLDLDQRLVQGHYLKQFNEETIVPKHFKHCGEPCPAVCKKMRDVYKKDYEPYQALGPLAGIFDQRAAERVNHYGDALGFDAIALGGQVAWLMEVLHTGLLKPEDLGLSKMPIFEPENFDPVNDSDHNADLALEIIDLILSEQRFDLNLGIRRGAAKLDAHFGTDTGNLAVYTAFGETGAMVPNQYWTPGMFAPMAIMGKYFCHYKSEFLPPFKLGEKCAQRLVKELYSDNNGMCRFHRGWIEAILPDLIEKHFGTQVDFEAHHMLLARKIHAGNKPVFWETQRTIDLIAGFICKVNSEDPELGKWQERFAADKASAAREFWDEILRGIDSVLA